MEALLQSTGGARGWAERLDAKRRREAARCRREKERPAESERRRSRLLKGLAVLRLPLRGGSERCRAYINSGGEIAPVLRSAAHMHWLHEHTNGAYGEAVEACVQDEGEHRGYYAGIYREATQMVQQSPEFRLPGSLPWLAEFATTQDALDAALSAADPDEQRKRMRRDDLCHRRAAALEERQATFAAAVAAAVGAEEAPAHAQAVSPRGLKVQAEHFGVGAHACLRYFDAVLTTRVAVADVCALAVRLRDLSRKEVELSQSTPSGSHAARLFRAAVRSNFDGDIGEMSAQATAAAEAERLAHLEATRMETIRPRFRCHGVGCNNMHSPYSPLLIDGRAVCGACYRTGAAVEGPA